MLAKIFMYRKNALGKEIEDSVILLVKTNPMKGRRIENESNEGNLAIRSLFAAVKLPLILLPP